MLFLNKKSVVKVLQMKMKEYGSEKIQLCSSLRTLKKPTYFWIAPDGTGIQTNKLPKNHTLQWEMFEAIVKKANSLGGQMYRGDSIARSGGRIGIDLTEDIIDGLIPMQFEGATYGDTVLSRSTYFSGILQWAGIVTIHKSIGKGSYITVNPEYRDI